MTATTMTETSALEALKPTLEEIAVAEVESPDVPMAVFNQQGRDLATFLAENEAVRARLVEVGIAADTVAALGPAIAAASEAESVWRAVYSPRTPDEVEALEAEAAEQRERTMAAARWNLRHDRIAQGTLDAIAAGSGRADLAADLEALAVLVEAQADAFATDATFDAAAASTAARSAAERLREAMAGARADLSRSEAKDLRDRAFTYADSLVSELRSAARYAFRDDPSVLAHFRDRYARRRGRLYRSRREPSVTTTP